MKATYNPHLSVDCVIFGCDGKQLNVLLVERFGYDNSSPVHDMKLPGSLIYINEELDLAPHRVLKELTGLKDLFLMQFKAFGGLGRTLNPYDRIWLEKDSHVKVSRVITIAYMSLTKMDKKLRSIDSANFRAKWCPLSEVKKLAFDHNDIIKEAVEHIRRMIQTRPSVLFDLLPKKFTASELRQAFQVIQGQEIDVRNFHKKIAMMPYVVPLNEFQEGVSHRAARYYRFDKKIFNNLYK